MEKYIVFFDSVVRQKSSYWSSIILINEVPKYWRPFQMCKQLIFAKFYLLYFWLPFGLFHIPVFLILFLLISFRHPVVFILHKEWVIWSTTRNTLSTISHRSCLCVWSAMPEPETVQITPTPSIHISQHPPSPPPESSSRDQFLCVNLTVVQNIVDFILDIYYKSLHCSV